MKYFHGIKRFNQWLAVASGVLVLVIAILWSIEVVMRYFFRSPTSWIMNVSQYILIWIPFLASAACFQYKSHISVDFVRSKLYERYGAATGKVLALICYFACLVFVVVIGLDSVILFKDAITLGKMTLGTVQIPIAYLYSAMVLGSIFMAITVIAIMVVIISGHKEYIK